MDEAVRPAARLFAEILAVGITQAAEAAMGTKSQNRMTRFCKTSANLSPTAPDRSLYDPLVCSQCNAQEYFCRARHS
jgi:hypothetical protein